MVTARTGGVLTELRVAAAQRCKKGDIIAVLSDDAREAQVAQAQALVDQRKAELDAKRRLIASGALPKLDLVNLEVAAQGGGGRAGDGAKPSATAASCARRGTASITDVPAEVGSAAFSMAGKEIAPIVALDPMLAVVEVSERKLAGVKVGDTAEVRLVTGQTRRRAASVTSSKSASQRPRAPIASRSRCPMPTARFPTASPPRSSSR